MNTATKQSIQALQALGPKTSSLFDVEQARHGKLFHAGASTTSFSYEPPHDDMRSTKRPVFEPTYRLGPRRKFKPNAVKSVIKSVLTEHLHNKPYIATAAGDQAKVITTEIQSKVKRMRFDRCKLIVNVTIGQKLGQCVDMTSRSVWDRDTDSFATATIETPTLYAVGTVFGIYFE